EAWPNLAALLVRHQRADADLGKLLRRHAEDMGTPRSPATLMYWRIGEPLVTGEHRSPGLPSWVTPPPQDPQASSAAVGPVAAGAVQDSRWHEVVKLNTHAFQWWQRQRADTAWASRHLAERGFTPAPEHG